MKGVVITPKSETEHKFLADLLKKLGVASIIVSAEEIEDLGLARMMKDVDKTKKVSRETIMRKLRS